MFFDFGTAAEEGEFDEKAHPDEVAAEFFDENGGGVGGSPRGEEVIDEEYGFAWGDGVFVDFDHGFAVFEFVGAAFGGPGEFAFFTDRDEAGAEPVGDDGAENEPAGVDANDLVNFVVAGGFDESPGGDAPEFGIAEDGGDVFEDDAGFWEIRDIADAGVEFSDRCFVHVGLFWGAGGLRQRAMAAFAMEVGCR